MIKTEGDSTSPLNSCCIGIVDDDKEIVWTYKKILSRRGMDVCLVANDGVDAIRLFYEQKEKPGIIIMDERMAVMCGTEAARMLSHGEPRPDIIMISADANVRDEAFRSGARVFLSKPISIKVILEAIELVKKNNSSQRYYYDRLEGFVVNA